MRLRRTAIALFTGILLAASGGTAMAGNPESIIICNANSYTPSTSHSGNTISGSGDMSCSEQPATMVFTVDIEIALTQYGTYRELGGGVATYVPRTEKYLRYTTWCEPYSLWARTKVYLSASIPGDTDSVTVYSPARWVTVAQC